MDSFKANDSVDHSVALIDWSTPESTIKSNTNENCANNPFDVMELKAASMDPFDLEPNKISLREDPPCGNILSPFGVSEIKQSQKNISLSDIINDEQCFKQNIMEQSNVIKNQSKDDNVNLNVSEHIVTDQPEEINILDNINKNLVESQDRKLESILTSDIEELELIKISSSNEEEKNEIIEQTRLRIQTLIENGKKNFQEKLQSIPSLPQYNSDTSLWDTGFLQSSDNDVIYNDFTSTSSYNKTNSINTSKSRINIVDVNDNNASNLSSGLFNCELNSFDLNSLKPEWVVDNFNDTEKSWDFQTDKTASVTEPIHDNGEVDIKLKTLNCIGVVNSKPSGFKTATRSMLNKRIQNKGPFVANIPLQQMVVNYEDIENEVVNNPPSNSDIQVKPVASSTPTLNNSTQNKTPSIGSTKISRHSLRRSMPNSLESPIIKLSTTKCINKNTPNKVNNNYKSISETPKRKVSINHSLKRRSNSTIVSDEVNKEKTKIKNSTNLLPKSKSEVKINEITKPTIFSANKISGLPLPKRFTIPPKGKENVRHY